MTETDWLNSVDPRPMITSAKLSVRKQRLLASACCRRQAHLLTHQECFDMIEANDRFADGLIDLQTLIRARRKLDHIPGPLAPGFEWSDTWRAKSDAIINLMGLGHNFDLSIMEAMVSVSVDTDEFDRTMPINLTTTEGIESLAREREEYHARFNALAAPERLIQAGLVRCVTGNPFRLFAFNPSWRTEAVASLARGIYDERTFDRLPVLADALEDAGCTDAEALAHCRGDGPHARGCWVVDAVLGLY